MSVGIRGIATYLPERVVGNDELIERFGWDRSFLEDKLGIRERRIAAADEGAADMAVAAAERLFREQPALERDAVDLVVLCTQNPDYGLPHSSALVQSRLGLPSSAACFDLGLGCSGFVYGLAVVRSMIETLGLRNALLLTSDPYSKVIDPGDRGTSPLFGDGAAATWVAADAGNAVGAFTFGTDGAGSEHLIVRKADLADGAAVACLSMNGRAIFEFMLERIPADLERCADANGIGLGDVDLFVLHQASAYMLGYLVRRMKLDAAKVPVMLAETGNTVSSTIPFVLERLAAEDGLAGRTALLSGFGVGLSWATTVVRFE
jgi:3-oxoacyl-[acyl-carrier-protein] synthase-3